MEGSGVSGSKFTNNHADIIKIDFILDLEIWVMPQQSDYKAATVWAREVRAKTTQKETKSANCIYIFCYDTTIKSRFL